MMQKITYKIKDQKTNLLIEKTVYTPNFKSAIDFSRKIQLRDDVIGKPLLEEVA